ncbi:MAG: thiamine phosphate synthase [Proteobacteria bacterium]|nr:thiamine phosphate synthase [Pseudomonadota bacterium]
MLDRSSRPEKGALWTVAQALNRRAAPKRPLPPLLFLTDPQRTPDPVPIAERLPSGAGVVYRGFGAADAPEVAERLAAVARAQGLTLLIGVVESLAEACGAQGLHLPERMIHRVPEIRRDHPDWVITVAAHNAAALRQAAEAGADAALLSTVFHSQSPSAGPALGADAFGRMVAEAGLPVYALGGVDDFNASHLSDSGAVGIAAVEGVIRMEAEEAG